MTLEERLVDALRQADEFQPSPDLFGRLERTIDEDRDFRRRRLLILGWIAFGLSLVVAWVALSAEPGLTSRLFIDSWRLVVAFLLVAGAIVIVLAPHIRRFGQSFVDDVFHLSPQTATKFVSVLDIAYYSAFTGLALVDADVWELSRRVVLWPALEDWLGRLGMLLMVMGVLHAINVVALPILGLLYNSLVRRDLRRRAGIHAPPESPRASRVETYARWVAVGVPVLGAVIVFLFILIGPGSVLLGSLE